MYPPDPTPAAPKEARGPRLPRPLALPLGLLPDSLHSRVLTVLLNRALAGPLQDGELDFLYRRVLAIRVRDAAVAVHLTLGEHGLQPAPAVPAADLAIEASVYDFLRLLGQQEDPDTLVFQRRLVMQGDTELGLELKNFLDGLDVDSLGLYRQLAPLLRRLLPVYRRVFR
ncbi:MAG TPA: sterol-binding protein [Gammaproteobacteria bacterium]|nr:sterol-binding protein [Gammaproteobacteria bacterium]